MKKDLGKFLGISSGGGLYKALPVSISPDLMPELREALLEIASDDEIRLLQAFGVKTETA